MPLSQFQKNRLKSILRQMAADGESEANMDARIKDFVDEAETIRAQHETRLAEERAVQPALVSPPPPMAGAVSPWGIVNPKADWSQFAPGVVEGMVKDFPVGLYNLFAHPVESVKGIPHMLDPLAGTPRDVGRFTGATAAPSLLGLGASKAVGAVGKFAAPEATLTKVKGMIHNAYNGLLKTGTPEAPSSLDYAMPYILEEAKGKPFIDLHHFKTLVDSASDNFSSMMRGLEDQFRGIPLNLAHVKDAIMKEIPSITSTTMGKSIAKWAFETFDKVSDLGDFLQKRAELNEKLRTFERKNKVAQRDVMGNPKAAADVNAVNKIRDIIDNTIDAHAGGNINARAMYQLESALKDVKEAGPEAVQANENLKAGVAGRRLGSLPSQEAVGLAASVPRSPYAIYRGTMGVTKQLTSKFNMPDALVAKAGQLLQEGGLIRQPGKLAVQAPMQWWQNPPPVNPPGAPPPPSGVQGVSPGVPGSMPPAVRQPVIGQVVEPGGAPPNAPVNPPAQIGPTAMPNLVQVGPGKWVAQDVLEAGRPPSEVGPGRVFNLPPYAPTTADAMEFNQSIINRPTRKVGKPPKSTWRMKKDLRPVEPQPGELDVKPTQFYRGGPESSMPRGTAQDVIDYERNELGNNITVEPGVDPNTVPTHNLHWLTDTEKAASEYGDVYPFRMTNPRIIARDTSGGMLVHDTRVPVETQPFNVQDLRPEFTQPQVNPLAPERMQETPLIRDELIRPPEGPTKKVGKPPRPLKVSDTRTVKPKEGELEVKSSAPEQLSEPSSESTGSLRSIGPPRPAPQSPSDRFAARVKELKSQGHDFSSAYEQSKKEFGGLPKPNTIIDIEPEPTVTNAPRQPGLDADVYNVSWPGTDKQSTMYAKPGESIDDVVSRFKSKFPRE